VYRSGDELAETVASFLADGFAAGEAAIVVLRPASWRLVADRLAAAGWDVDALGHRGLLRRADAHETLAAILDGAMPSPVRFDEIIGGLIDDAAGDAPVGRVRAFGEMVDILCRRRELAAADALEELWNRLGRRGDFALLCGYKLDVFDREAQVDVLPQVYDVHSEVTASRDAERMDRAVEEALVAVLGRREAKKVYDQVALQAHVLHVPAAQRALMWVSANMPTRADRVLTTARLNFAVAAV
jgi:hypothetical protein